MPLEKLHGNSKNKRIANCHFKRKVIQITFGLYHTELAHCAVKGLPKMIRSITIISK